MALFRFLVVGIFLTLVLTSCLKKPGEEKPKVHCPACGAEVDAFYQKRF